MGIPSNTPTPQNDLGSMAAYTVSTSLPFTPCGWLIQCSHLVVVALAQTQFWQTARGQIEYNLTHLRQGVRRIIQALEA